MKNLSVLDVQRILREHADPQNNGGHDVISQPGAVTIKGTTFPLTFSHSLVVEHPESSYTSPTSLTTHIPLNESGNVMQVLSRTRRLGETNLRHHYTVHQPASVPTGHPQLPIYHTYHWNRDRDLENIEDPKEFYLNAQKAPSTNVTNHNPSEAAWGHMMGDFYDDDMSPTMWFPKPHDMDIKHFGKLVGVVHGRNPNWSEITTHLYDPTNEKLITLGTHKYDEKTDTFKLL